MKHYLIGFLILSHLVGFAQYHVSESIFQATGLIEYDNGKSIGSSIFFSDTNDYIYILTAKHVLLDTSNRPYGDFIDVTVCPDVYSSKVFNFRLKVPFILQNDLLISSSSYDIAAVKIGITINDTSYFFTDAFVSLVSLKANMITTMPDNFITEFKDVIIGSDCFIIGYPSALRLKDNDLFNYHKPLVRKGIVSQLYLKRKYIIIDATAYGGNSGGPVFQLNVKESRFTCIGLVIKYIPHTRGYYDNSGYLVAVPIEEIRRLIY